MNYQKKVESMVSCYSRYFLPFLNVLHRHGPIGVKVKADNIVTLTYYVMLRSYHGGRWGTCVSWLSHTSTNTIFFPKPPTTFLTCFCRGKRRKYAGKKVCLNRGSNSQPPGPVVRHAHHRATRAERQNFGLVHLENICRLKVYMSLKT